MNNNDMNFWFLLSIIANFCQIESYQMNKQQIDNSQLLKFMQHQDSDLLEKIIQQNQEIIELLKGGKN